MSNFEFGFAKEDITPKTGVALCGYFNPRPNKGAYDPLQVKAAAFRTADGGLAAVVSLDLCLCEGSLFRKMDELLAKENCPLAGKILYCCTHTHTGPYTSLIFSDERDPEYMQELEGKIISAVKKAYASLGEAELYATESSCTSLAFNRRYIMKNGKTLTNPGKCNPEIDHPEGGMDPRIMILEVRQKNRPVFMMVNLSNHTDTIGGDIVSADWPGRMEAAIQQELDCGIPVMTIIAPQGNINHFDVTTTVNQTGYAEAIRIGKGYAAEVLAARYKLTLQEDLAISTRKTTFAAPYLQLTDEEYAEAKKTYEENKDAVMEGGRDFTSEDIAKGVPFVKKFFAERAIECRENPIKEERIEEEIAIFFNKNIAMVSLPAEPFIEIGEEIRKSSPYPMTLLAALGQGEVGYVGLPRHYGNGGYETSPSRGLADRTVGLTMIECAKKLLN